MASSKPAKAKKSTPAPIKNYLVLFNLVSAAGWSYVLAQTIIHLFNVNETTSVLGNWTTTYDSVGRATALVQSLALMEVLHVLGGWVRSPIGTTAAQVASRLFLVWGVFEPYPSVRSSPFFTSMVLAWSVTEVIRYSFYACNLLGSEPYVLLWLRYTTFYVLYPVGASSEAFVNFASLPALGSWGVRELFRAMMFLIWWPGLYIMYTHMIRQRRKVLGRGAGRKTE